MRPLKIDTLILLGALLLTIAPCQALVAQRSFYDFTVTDVNGDEFDLAQLQGKKVLVVNTASRCTLTPQYKKLEELYQQFGGENFVILAFPCNDFAGHEPGSNEEIASFCSTNYAITFPVMAKISVKGDTIHPLYNWLTKASENGVEESRVMWNFQKYLIDEGGTLAGHVAPIKKPDCKEIVSWITAE
jgi:glutathione peroxidase